MDEFNNNNNPFNEDKTPAGGSPDPYNAQNDPYNQQPGQVQNGQPYQQPYGVPPQNGQPYQQQYGVPPQNGQYQQGQNPYNMPQGGYGYNQQNIPQNGYAAPQGYGVPYQPQQTGTGMAVASLVLGIISICTGLFMFNFPFLFLLPIIGIILGIVFKSKKLPVGKGMSTAGIITSIIGLLIPIALLVFVIVMLVTHGAELMQYMKQISPEQYEQLYEIYGDQFPQWFSGAVSFLIK